MAESLLTLSPDSVQQGPTQILFYFGAEPGRLAEQANGAEFGVVSLTPEHPRFSRFRVYRGRVGNAYVRIDERLLTAEETAHFEAMAKKL
jgi:hypothetical protein